MMYSISYGSVRVEITDESKGGGLEFIVNLRSVDKLAVEVVVVFPKLSQSMSVVSYHECTKVSCRTHDAIYFPHNTLSLIQSFITVLHCLMSYGSISMPGTVMGIVDWSVSS